MNASLEHAIQLLKKAREDALMMDELSKHPRSPVRGIGFHAQQSIEKACKALLIARNAKTPFTHDLQLLLNLLKNLQLVPPGNEDEILRPLTIRHDFPL